MLQVEGLTVRYGAIEAVHGISFEVDAAECVTILGANGAGKSSTLKALAGLQRPSLGRVTMEGQVVTGLPAHRMARLGMSLVPEGRQIFSTLTIRENLELGGYTQGASANRQSIERVIAIFPVLEPRMSTLAGSLSGGEQQMLALGRALMTRPRLLMMDEPSLGLAPIVTGQIFQTIQEIVASGVSVLLVEQNVHRALGVASRGYVLELGGVVLEGSAAALLADDHVRLAYLGHGMGEAE
ncbi:MAG TPA: ABC transporter ATP-binding protein [Candidatus Dormibacteraeota bacterium]